MEDDRFVVNHSSRTDFRSFGVETDAGVAVGSQFEGGLNSNHLSEMFRMVAVREVESCNIHALIDEFDGVIGMFSFGTE